MKTITFPGGSRHPVLDAHPVYQGRFNAFHISIEGAMLHLTFPGPLNHWIYNLDGSVAATAEGIGLDWLRAIERQHNALLGGSEPTAYQSTENTISIAETEPGHPPMSLRCHVYLIPQPSSVAADPADSRPGPHCEVTPSVAADPANSRPAPEVNEALLWYVQTAITDGLDPRYKAVPSASMVFLLYCRDRLTLAAMKRAHHHWSARTLKKRKADLQSFLRQKFKVELSDFFVDRRIFNAAQRTLEYERARHIAPDSLDD